MAGWKNDEDIARDMDILSGIQSPEGKVKSYSSWGRGQDLAVNAPFDSDSVPELRVKASQKEFQWFQEKRGIEKLPDSISRGRKLEILKENYQRSRELEVHEQLRAAVGPGYSNTFIEESYKKRLRAQQFEDLEEAQTDLSAFVNNGDKFVGPSEKISSKATESVFPEGQKPKENKNKRRKSRQYRNAVLESLERLNTSESTSEASKMPTVKVGNLFGGKGSDIPPAGYLPRGFCSKPFVEDESKKPFEYKESEFPEL